VKERPILFKGDMVRANLEGRKTETRRVCKGQRSLSNIYDFPVEKCPYGQVGDRLWVRETWWRKYWHGLVSQEDYYETSWIDEIGGYCATDEKPEGNYAKCPSIYMFRKYSRINMEITGISVERLQDITEEGALAEGVTRNMRTKFGYAAEESEETFNLTQARSTFHFLWNSINAKPKPKKSGKIISHYESYPWSEADRDKRDLIGKQIPHYCYPNPWVWVVKYKVVKS
jgi:hypothetical protein